MKKIYVFTLALAFLCVAATSTAMAQCGISAGAGGGMGSMRTSATEIGQLVADFTLSDTSGKKHSLSSLKGEKATVLIFISTQCPVSNGYNERMEKLAADYRAKGVNVIGINANAPESLDDIKAHAAKNNLTFTILKDAGSHVADQLGATNTPEAFLLDATGKLVYRGRIDNSRSGQTISANDLRDAIEATLAGKPVANSFVRAFGCSIKRG